jgi:hypothetical protein
MSELRTQLINAARLSFNSGHWLLTARLCEALAELEMEAAIADVNPPDVAWNGRTVAVPLQERPGPRHPNEQEARCKECGRLAYVEMHALGINPGSPRLVPGLARHADPGVDVDHRVRIKA